MIATEAEPVETINVDARPQCESTHTADLEVGITNGCEGDATWRVVKTCGHGTLLCDTAQHAHNLMDATGKDEWTCRTCGRGVKRLKWWRIA